MASCEPGESKKCTLDTKKRLSSIRKSIVSKEAPSTTCTKKRISFSGRKSIRLFSNTDETHTASFDMTDQSNNSEPSLSATAARSGAEPTRLKMNSTIAAVAGNKENIPCKAERSRDTLSRPSVASFSATTDFIDWSQQASVLRIDNSCDLSMMESEKMKMQPTANHPIYQAPSRHSEPVNGLLSFSVLSKEQLDMENWSKEATVNFACNLMDSTAVAPANKQANLTLRQSEDIEMTLVEEPAILPPTTGNKFDLIGEDMNITCSPVPSSPPPLKKGHTTIVCHEELCADESMVSIVPPLPRLIGPSADKRKTILFDAYHENDNMNRTCEQVMRTATASFSTGNEATLAMEANHNLGSAMKSSASKLVIVRKKFTPLKTKAPPLTARTKPATVIEMEEGGISLLHQTGNEQHLESALDIFSRCEPGGRKPQAHKLHLRSLQDDDMQLDNTSFLANVEPDDTILRCDTLFLPAASKQPKKSIVQSLFGDDLVGGIVPAMQLGSAIKNKSAMETLFDLADEVTVSKRTNTKQLNDMHLVSPVEAPKMHHLAISQALEYDLAEQDIEIATVTQPMASRMSSNRKARETLPMHQDIDVDYSINEPEEDAKDKQPQLEHNEKYPSSHALPVIQPMASRKSSHSKARQTLVMHQDIDVDYSINDPEEHAKDKQPQLEHNEKYPSSHALSVTQPMASRKSAHRKARQTLLMHQDIDVDYSINEPEEDAKDKQPQFEHNEKYPSSHALPADLEQKSRKKNITQMDSLNIMGDLMSEITPPPYIPKVLSTPRHLYDWTPHRSIIEFEYFERMTKLEEQEEHGELGEALIAKEQTELELTADMLNNDLQGTSSNRRLTNYNHMALAMDTSGVMPLDETVAVAANQNPNMATNNNRRCAVNLTPILPFAKRRQTLFTNCTMSESPVKDTATPILAEEARPTERRTIYSTKTMDLTDTTLNDSPYGGGGSDSDVNKPLASESVVLLATPSSAAQHLANEMKLTLMCSSSSPESPADGDQASAHKPCEKNEFAEFLPHGLRPVVASRIPMAIGSAKKKMPLLRCQSLFRTAPELDEDDNLQDIIELSHYATLTPESPPNGACKNASTEDIDVYESATDDVEVNTPPRAVTSGNDLSSVTISSNGNGTPHSEDRQPPTRRTRSGEMGDDTRFRLDFVNLSANLQEIDKTRLSLVETLVDDSSVMVCDCADEQANAISMRNQTENVNTKMVNATIAFDDTLPCVRATPVMAESMASNQKQKRHSLPSGKCKFCLNANTNQPAKDEMTMNYSIMDSFALPKLSLISPLQQLFKRVQDLRQTNKLKDAHEYFRRMSLQRIGDQSMAAAEVTDGDCAESLIAAFKKETACSEDIRIPTRGVRLPPTFTQRLQALLVSDKGRRCNWILDNQHLHNGTQVSLLTLYHRKITTFSVTMEYVVTPPLGDDIKVISSKLCHQLTAEDGSKCLLRCGDQFHSGNWLPIDFALDFQLKLALVLDVYTPNMNNDERCVHDVLQKLDSVCIGVYRLVTQMWRAVCKANAALMRNGQQIFIRKIVRRPVTQPGEHTRIEEIEFRINVLNVKEICYEHIIMPSLHMFNESIQLMPIGVAFVEAFLQDPTQYLRKPNVCF